MPFVLAQIQRFQGRNQSRMAVSARGGATPRRQPMSTADNSMQGMSMSTTMASSGQVGSLGTKKIGVLGFLLSAAHPFNKALFACLSPVTIMTHVSEHQQAVVVIKEVGGPHAESH